MSIQLLKNISPAVLFKKPVIKPSELPTLLKRISTLLNEGYTFTHSIEMLLPYHVKKYEPVQQEISGILRGGGSATQVFQLLCLDKQYLVSIELAEVTGKLSEAIGLVAKQLVFQQQAKTKLIKVMSYPLILFTFLILLFLAFRTYFLPNMSSVITSRVHSESSASIQWSKFFLHMPDYIVAVAASLGIALSVFIYYLRKKRIEMQLHLLFKLPLIGLFWRLFLTRQFARHLGNLLLAGFSLQKAFDHLKFQQHQKQIAYIAGILQERILIGDSLERAVEIVGFFYPKFEHFIAHGEASGLLGRELILYCELLDEKLQKIIERILAVIQPLLFVVIAVCVIAAYLSILIPMYDVIDFI
ncbi:competence type IV pilus assembly protein ComGB [Solibacillus sp. FSL W7-1464]|uniref:competence type IV pilus assembly protein ComGB n=1 Tax=Solibacillus sp. FSL W7-1464 TaxID=2921706 RepID=UPI0030F93975